ncbi:signal peptidase I [Ahniella affigens]|uniref:Signal peptidase I n=1 Tax=Ahniella affigens TaxID=2021234 RepID=A0A2P1PZ19_9GAMM|nr:signal peptidase I [Ahniella affigens]
MRLDFALILVCLAAFTGFVWGVDKLFFEKGRKALGEAGKEPTIVEYSRSFFPVIFVVLLLRSFIAEPFKIPSSSMMPTLLIGDFILVNKFAYGIRLPVINTKVIALGEPKRGDVVVFKYPGFNAKDENRGKDYIKRVIGLPGDVVEYRGKTIFINGEAVAQISPESYVGVGQGSEMTGSQKRVEMLPGREHDILIIPELTQLADADGAFTVGPKQYFVMGDNRDRSEDSRFWGMVPEENLVGRAFFIWMNWDGENGGVEFSRIGTIIKGGES